MLLGIDVVFRVLESIEAIQHEQNFACLRPVSNIKLMIKERDGQRKVRHLPQRRRICLRLKTWCHWYLERPLATDCFTGNFLLMEWQCGRRQLEARNLSKVARRD